MGTSFKGRLGSVLSLDGEYLTITHRGLASNLHGRRSIRLHVSEVSGIDYHPARFGFNGHLTVITPGVGYQRTALGRQSHDRGGDPMSVQLARRHNADAEAFVEAFEQAKHNN